MTNTLNDLSELYADNKACAALVNLTYIEGDDVPGITRAKAGTGFTYKTAHGHTITDEKLRERIEGLAIPPAWEDVWICPAASGHIQATGIDEKGRKQYIYHPKWRTMRDLIKFYRMIVFAEALPMIRQEIDASLQHPELDREKIIGAMLWLLDNTYIRIGNDAYFEENESVGLTTLSSTNVTIEGDLITLSFRGKSGKDQIKTAQNAVVAEILTKLKAQHGGTRLFRYKENDNYLNIEADDINAYLHMLTGLQVSAKDFRTWGGTLMAFNHFVETSKLPDADTPAPEKVAIDAVDAAADALGNTRAVARSSYVHPDILQAYSDKHFDLYYDKAKKKRATDGLDKREVEMLSFLEQLFEVEFELLQTK